MTSSLPPGGFSPPGPEAKVFVISVAAELSGLHPQTLRSYDRLGIVQPGRTGGGGRRYSLRDVELLREVAHLTSEGLGLEGVKRVIELKAEVEGLRQQVAQLQHEITSMQAAMAVTPNLPAPIARGSMVLWRKKRR